MKRVVLVVAIISAGLSTSCGPWPRSGSSVVGVWKATDEHGNEHYWEFHKDGTLDYWDRTHSWDGKFEESPRFKATYTAVDGKTFATKKKGFPPEPLGRLTFTSENEMKQDSGGEAMRRNLVYRKVAPE
jgi:hypothetical protein